MNEQTYYKVIMRTDDNDLLSVAATCYGLGVVYKEEGRTPAPHHGPLLVFDTLPNAARFARGRLKRTVASSLWNWEIWECRAGNPRPAPRVLKMWTLGRDGMGKVADFWDRCSLPHLTMPTPVGTVACDWVELTRKVS